MAESYCGKNCDQCAEKEILGCPGCKVGPGRLIGTECEQARCCITKGLTECAACEFCEDCYTVNQKDRFLQLRLETAEKEKNKNETLANGAPILGKWLGVAFWLIVPSLIGFVLANSAVFEASEFFIALGQLVSSVCAVIYSLVLLRLGFIEKRYRFAALCVMVGALISSATNYMFSGSEVPMWAMAISIPTTVLSFLGEYFEFMAHSTVLANVNDKMSTKWKTLWVWYLGSSVAHYGGVLLALVIPDLGVMLINAGQVGTLITRVLKLLYLRQTVRLFRSYRNR